VPVVSPPPIELVLDSELVLALVGYVVVAAVAAAVVGYVVVVVVAAAAADVAVVDVRSKSTLQQ